MRTEDKVDDKERRVNAYVYALLSHSVHIISKGLVLKYQGEVDRNRLWCGD